MTHTPHDVISPAADHAERLILDGTKLAWHMDRVQAWERGERIAPITIDMALTRKCNASCSFCYAMLQNSEDHEITQEVMAGFLEDSAEMGVRGISLVSDGESTLSPAFAFSIKRGAELGISMANGTNAILLTPEKAEAVLPFLTYLRVNCSAGQPKRYAEIMGMPERMFDRMVTNVAHMVRFKQEAHLGVTLGLQMVLMPQDADQIIPFAQLGIDLGVDYAIIKHCSDDEDGSIGVDYGKYAALTPLLRQAEAMSTPRTQIVIKWNKIGVGNARSYSRCFGPPFLIQISGSGLVAPCGMLFNAKYSKFHIGNIVTQRWRDIWRSDRYWEVMNYLASARFDASRMCGALCLQDMVNRTLNEHVKGTIPLVAAAEAPPAHLNFV